MCTANVVANFSVHWWSIVLHTSAIHSKKIVLTKNLSKTFAQNTQYCKSQRVIYCFFVQTNLFLNSVRVV